MYKRIAILAILSITSTYSVAEKQASRAPVSAKQEVANLAQTCKDNEELIKQRQARKSLYIRLGERKGVAKFADALYESHKGNEKIGHFFEHVPKQRFVTNVTDFVVAGTGGGGQYKGRDMVSVHKNLGISHEDFLVAGGDISDVLTGLGHGEELIQEFVCILVSMVPQVVTK